MLFHEVGASALPTILFLHGGGLSDWSLEQVAAKLQAQYHVVTPVIDGHGEDSETRFQSIEASAQSVIAYIDAYCGGRVFALGGLSIGAQIVAEVLAQRAEIAAYAVLESALVCPIPGAAALAAPTYALCYGLVKKRWFAKAQAGALCLPDAMFERYYADSIKMSKQSLINMTVSNGTYRMKEEIAHTGAKVLVIVGEKEISIMKKSARLLHCTIANSRLFIARGKAHGELSLRAPEEYTALLAEWFSQP